MRLSEKLDLYDRHTSTIWRLIERRMDEEGGTLGQFVNEYREEVHSHPELIAALVEVAIDTPHSRFDEDHRVICDECRDNYNDFTEEESQNDEKTL